MQILRETPTKINFGLLICTLYTIVEDNNIFKNVSIKSDIFLNIKKREQLTTNREILQELCTLINKSSLRKFAYLLIKPILTSTNSSTTFNTTEKNVQKNENEKILLKKYLRRFQYNYRRYFLYKNRDYENSPANKEINTYAIKTLFLLAGI